MKSQDAPDHDVVLLQGSASGEEQSEHPEKAAGSPDTFDRDEYFKEEYVLTSMLSLSDSAAT